MDHNRKTRPEVFGTSGGPRRAHLQPGSRQRILTAIACPPARVATRHPTPSSLRLTGSRSSAAVADFSSGWGFPYTVISAVSWWKVYETYRRHDDCENDPL